MNATAWNEEFRLNARIDGSQLDVQLATLDNGNFVAVWTDSSVIGPDTSGGSLRAQIFRADGSRVGSEFQVNANAPGPQYEPTITTLAGGGFAVLWTASAGGGGTTVEDIHGQVFSDTGAKVGSEFFANTGTNSRQLDSTVAGLSDGRFVAFWSSGNNLTTLGLSDIVGQIFNADGSKSGGEFFAYGAARAEPQREPVVEALTNGRFVVAWTDGSGGATAGYIRAQVYNANGSRQGSEFLVNAATAGSKLEPDIAAFSDGRFVVTWTDNSQTGSDTSSTAIRARVFNTDGTANTAEFVVNTVSNGRQDLSTAAVLKDGRFVIAWTDKTNGGSGATVKAQVFNANGTKSGVEFKVPTNRSLGDIDPSITVLDDGRFVIGWRDSSGDASAGSVQGQIFDVRSAAVNLNGTAAADDLFGTRFADRIVGNDNNDYVNGERGADTLSGGSGSDTLKGGGGDDGLFGGSGTDSLEGGGANDFLFGGSGADVLSGGVGFDYAAYSRAPARVKVYLDGSGTNSGEAAGDTFASIEGVLGSASGDTIQGNSAANNLQGNGGNDVIGGGNGNDTLGGGDGRDTLNGGNNSDVLNGGLGNDVLNGGTGADRFVFNSALSSTSNVDTISQLSSIDKIVLEKDIFTALGATFTPSEFRAINSGTSFASVDVTDHIIYVRSTGQLFYDRDGSGTDHARVLFAEVPDGTNVTFGQFLLA